MAHLLVEQGTVEKLIQLSNPADSSLSLHSVTVVSVYVTTPAVSKQVSIHINLWWLSCLPTQFPFQF
jgi:hypothetical protein